MPRTVRAGVGDPVDRMQKRGARTEGPFSVRLRGGEHRTGQGTRSRFARANIVKKSDELGKHYGGFT